MKLDPSRLIGQTLNGMYTLVKPIGAGGMGAIFEAQHVRLQNKKYAVKLLHPAIAQDKEVFARFRREAEIASELGHDHIVEVHDFNVTDSGEPYMVMEMLDGVDLSQRLAARGAMTVDAVRPILDEICSGLDAAHRAGIVHRDLKPQNIFLCKRFGRDDFVKVLDFGVSKVRHSSSVVTKDHVLMGTPFYMSPEQADGNTHEIDSRTDVFALGAILWEMLIGRMAFESPTPMGAMYKVVHVDPQEVHTINGAIPPAVSAVIRRAMAKAKAARYDGVLELAKDYAAAVKGVMPGVAPPPLVRDPSIALPAGGTLPVATVEAKGSVPFTRPNLEALGNAETATPAPMVPRNPPTPSLVDLGSVGTISAATGQLEREAVTKRPRRLVPVVAGVLILGAGLSVAAYQIFGGKTTVVTTTPSPPPPPAPPPSPPSPPPVAVAIASSSVQITAPGIDLQVTAPPVKKDVTVHFDVTPKSRFTIKQNGKKLDGVDATLARAGEEVSFTIEAPGYVAATVKVVPDDDKTVSVGLVRRSSSGHNNEFQKSD